MSCTPLQSFEISEKTPGPVAPRLCGRPAEPSAGEHDLEAEAEDRESWSLGSHLNEPVGWLHRNMARLLTSGSAKVNTRCDTCPATIPQSCLKSLAVLSDRLRHLEVGSLCLLEGLEGFDVRSRAFFYSLAHLD